MCERSDNKGYQLFDHRQLNEPLNHKLIATF